jgi:hypothetical protein
MDSEAKKSSKAAVLAALTEAIEMLSRLKERLPVLLALIKELDRIAAGGRRVPARNTLVLQMAHDSFDMLVIDLNSLRERMLSGDPPGLFKIVEAHCRLYRRFTADDVNVDGFLHGPADRDLFHRESLKRRMLERWNDVYDRLFRRNRVRERHVEALRLQFKRETQPTADDRNKVRAHRYEHHASLDPFLPPTKVQEQIKVFERYLGDLLFLTNRSQHAMNWPVPGDAGTTAEDLADIIVFGSINLATLGYGMVPRKHGEGPSRWYWYHRKSFYESGHIVPGDDDESIDRETSSAKDAASGGEGEPNAAAVEAKS